MHKLGGFWVRKGWRNRLQTTCDVSNAIVRDVRMIQQADFNFWGYRLRLLLIEGLTRTLLIALFSSIAHQNTSADSPIE